MDRYRRELVVLGCVFALVGAYAALGFLAVPHFVKKSAIDFVRTHYGRQLTLADVHFNPFTLNLELDHLTLPDADGQKLLAFERLQVKVNAAASLWRRAVSFGAIVLEKPDVRAVVRRDGALNLADLGKGFPPEHEPKKPSAPLKLFIRRLAVIAGASTFEDRSRATPFHAEVRPIEFELRDFTTTGGTDDAYKLTAALPEGAHFAWSGTVRLAPLAVHGTFEISDLRARTLWNYLRDSLPFEISAGVIGLKGDYSLGPTKPVALALNVHNTTVTGLALRPKGGTQDYVTLARIEAEEAKLDLAHHAVNVAKVRLTGGDIQAWLSAQGALNLLELAPQGPGATAAAAPAASAATQPATPAAPPPSATGEAWSIAVPDVALEGFKISAEDRQFQPAVALQLDPLDVHVTGFSTARDAALAITVDSRLNTSGKIAVRARVAPGSGAVQAHVETTSFDLTALQPVIARFTSMTLLKGTIGATLDLERQPAGVLVVTGSTQVSDLRTVDNALKLDFIKWKDLRVADIAYRSSPASVRIGGVTAVEPYARMIIAPNRTLNITAVLTPPVAVEAGDAQATSAPALSHPVATALFAAAVRPAPGAPAKPAAQGAPLRMSIGTVKFVNGSANYADLWIKPSFAVGIQELGGTVTGLSSDPASRAKVDLAGKVDKYAPVLINGELNLLSAALYTDITMSLKDLDLTIVNPYSGHFTGYKIDKGKLSVDVSYRVEHRKLDAKQHFLVDQLELGERVESPDAMHLPFKIAVALLKDRNGVIDLDLPMSGSLDDPSFRIGPIVWKMFVNLIVKVATAPFALLGHLFGGGEKPNLIAFAPGSAELDKPTQEQLAALVHALKERPQLKLDVPIEYAPAIDRPPLAAAILDAALVARYQKSSASRRHPDTAGEALSDPARHFGLLVEEFRARRGKDAALPPSAVAVQQAKRGETPAYDPAITDLNAALLETVDVPDDVLLALGKKRAQAIQDALLSGGEVEAARVFIVNSPPKPETGDKVIVELAVK